MGDLKAKKVRDWRVKSLMRVSEVREGMCLPISIV